MSDGGVDLLHAIGAETERLAEAADGHLEVAVHRYPGWTLRDLMCHTGGVHRWVASLVEQRASERPDRASYRGRVPDHEISAWLRDGAARLVDELDRADEEGVWFFGRLAPASLWRARMAHETALHAWDADAAIDRERPIDASLAVSGLVEALELHLVRQLASAPFADGARLSIRPREASASAHRLESDAGRLRLEAHAAADRQPDCEIAGTACDLWLWVTGRRALERLQVSGDRRLALALEEEIAAMAVPSA